MFCCFGIIVFEEPRWICEVCFEIRFVFVFFIIYIFGDIILLIFCLGVILHVFMYCSFIVFKFQSL